MRIPIQKNCLALLPWPAIPILSLTAGCHSDGLSARAEIVQRGSQAISETVMLSLNGVYGAACTGHSGAWSLAIINNAPLDNSDLTVVKNDLACTLAITQLVGPVRYDAVPPIPLGGTYNPSSSAFVVDGAGGSPPVSFYGNGKIDPADFSRAFVVTFAYSQDPSLSSEDNKASYDEVGSAYNGNSINAPDYADDVNINVKIDVHNAVTAVSGSLDLTNGTQLGEAYVIDLGTMPASPLFAVVDGTFNAGTKILITGPNPSIPAAAFALLGTTLPVRRSVIIQHAENGVPSYQVITITFNLPS